jgi:two-component system, OmpR family, phosphate regulon sensor histidine kinase PhoR
MQLKRWESIIIYRIIAIISFLILLVVQYILVYNTYKLKDQRYFISARGIINDDYTRSVSNDKVYPGAQSIIDKYIYNNMSRLELLHKKSAGEFKALGDKVCDSIFTQLRKHSNMDSVFAEIVKQNKLGHDLEYSLMVTSIGVNFSNNHYFPLFKIGDQNPYLSQKIQSADGIKIDGDLKNINQQNMVTSLYVSSPLDHSYRIGFSLYVDTPNRYIAVLKQMAPMLALAVFSILLVVLIYFFTFKNWLKQKKLAEMQSDFVNSITHELHTPLATIIIANKNLQNDKINAQKENILSLTKIIERQSQRLKTLFERILDITTMNKFTLNKKEYILGKLLDDVLLDYRLMLSDNNIEFEFNRNNDDRIVFLDRFWFTTMLFNIFENAIKYNNNNVKKVEVTVSDTKDSTEIHIKDNGVGMPNATINHIFEKFYRDTDNEVKETNGLGLGLFYTRQSVEAHGWNLKVESKEKEGSTFIIIIPKGKFTEFNN